MTAANQNTPTPQTHHAIDCIRHNWTQLGYLVWFNDYGQEYWRHPQTGDVVSFYGWDAK